MRLTVDAVKWSADADGEWLSIRCRQATRLCDEIKCGEYDLTEHREKRSKNANGYMWELLSQLADVLDTTKEELYRQYVRDMGVFKDFVLTEDEANTFAVAWSRLGTGWLTERVDFTPDGKKIVVRAYYGSSTYNSKQMSRLLDAVVADCRDAGIDTMTPQDRSLLIAK